MKDSATDRRTFLRESGACLAHLCLLANVPPFRAQRAFAAAPAGLVVAQEPWGRLERIADEVWALISTPLEDRTTLCNGGIVQGRAGVLAIESFARPEGATWLAQQARSLTGRWPDAVVLTHYHGDHTSGLSGYTVGGTSPAVRATRRTRELVQEQDARREGEKDGVKERLLGGSALIDAAAATTLDLGDRTVRIVPRTGHTASDVTIEIDDPSIVFCGDLVWNRMFPNYMDATPSLLSRDVRALVRERSTTYVPGHGALAMNPDLHNYIALIDDVEAAASRAHEAGTDAAAAGAAYRIPEALGEWLMFSPRYFETAIGAWLRELRA
jgi:glyoxylase-like metal-dependent hydrolase (beta-lactamase superfamily II)